MIAALDLIKPDLVLIEAWQTAITDFSIDIAAKLGIPIAMISHGISIHPYTNELKYKLRALFWLYYIFFQFPKRLKKISALGVLDNKSNSTRFYDRVFALKLGLPVSLIPNMPINFSTSYLKRESRSAQIIVLGYFSPIKQQLAAINIFAKLPSYFTLKFIGEKKGFYYKKCLKKIKKFGLSDRVIFNNDQESIISYEISKSFLMLSTSITEAVPIHILEAMASGTPFVSSSVGAIANLRGGIIADDESAQINAILNLYSNASLWNEKSDEGLTQYKKEFTRNHVVKALKKFIKIVEDNQKNYG
jgi:glycosyltransferase involved in cell wall biosynthesis